MGEYKRTGNLSGLHVKTRKVIILTRGSPSSKMLDPTRIWVGSRRGDFYVYMGAGLHGGKAPITVANLKELEAVVETFRYLNSLPTTPSESDNYSD